MSIKSLIKTALLGAAITVASGPALADFPEKPVTLVVGFKEGGGTDTLARAFSAKMEAALGVDIIVENRGGGGGSVAATHVLKQEADGYTLGFTLSLAHDYIPLTGKADYSPDTIAYLGTIMEASTVLLSRADHGYSDFQGLIAKAKSDGYLTHGSLTAVDREIMKSVASAEGFELDIIPARGGSQLRAALIAGDTESVLGGASGLKLAASNDDVIAVATFNSERIASAPELPTLMELGYDLSMNTQTVLFTQAGVSPEIVEALSNAFKTAATDPEIIALVEKLGSRPVSYTPVETQQMIERQLSANESILASK